jgi:autotransporter-associated beta strand protein
MKKGRRSARRASALVVAAALTAVQQTRAGVSFDLRLTDGSHNAVVSSPGVYTVDLWTRVSGTNSTIADEGFQSGLFTLMSTQAGGGGFTSGGVTGATIDTNFQSFSGTTPLFRSGSGSDLNADGIQDWGSTSTSVSNSSYLFLRSSAPVLAGGTVGQQVDASTWEFKLASYTVNVGTVGTGGTFFNVVKPNATGAPVPAIYALARVDGTSYQVNGDNQQGAYSESVGVAFLAPGSTVTIPTTLAWDGGADGSGAQWGSAANWTPDPNTGAERVPGPTDRAVIRAAGTTGVIGIDMAGSTNNGVANEAAASVSLQAQRDIVVENSSATNGTLTLKGDIGGMLLANSSSASTLTVRDGANGKMGVALGNSGTIDVPNAGATILVSSAISGNGKAITKTGNGRLILGGANTYSGATKISFGSVDVSATGSLVSTDVTVNGKSELDVEGSLSSATALGAWGVVRFSIASQTLNTLAGFGKIELLGTMLTIGSGGFNGDISGSGGLIKNSPLGLTLTGSNSYTGNTTVAAGTLQGEPAALTGKIIDNGSVVCTGSGTLLATLSGTGSFTTNGFGGITLVNAGTYSGATNIQNGTVMVSAPNIFPSTSTMTLTGTLMVTNANQTFGRLDGSGEINFNGTLGTPTLTIGGTNAASSFSGSISGNVNVVKVGSGNLTLSGANTYTGTTSILAGKLARLSTNNSSGYVISSGATLQLGSNGAAINHGTVTALPGSTIDATGAIIGLTTSTLINNGVLTGNISAGAGGWIKGSGTFNGNVTLGAGGSISPGNSAGLATVGAVFLGGGGTYLFEVADATGAAGVGTDTLNVVNGMSFVTSEAPLSPFRIAVASLDASGSPGAPLHFDPALAYHWKLLHTGTGISGFASNKFAIDSGGFLPAVGSNHFSVSTLGNDLMLNYNPVPEPVGAGMIATGGLVRARRRRSSARRTA